MPRDSGGGWHTEFRAQRATERAKRSRNDATAMGFSESAAFVRFGWVCETRSLGHIFRFDSEQFYVFFLVVGDREELRTPEFREVCRVLEMAVLDERHHTFLQALMRRGPLLERESKSMYRELFSTSDGWFFSCLEFGLWVRVAIEEKIDRISEVVIIM